LTLILIIVLVIMNSLKNNEVQKAPQAILPPEPSAPTEIINDPLFEPVEVIQEGNESAKTQTLDQVAQKIKEESLQNAPSNTPAVVPPVVATPSKTTVQSTPIAKIVSAPTPQKTAPEPKPVAQKVYAQPTIAKVQKVEPKTIEAAPLKEEPKKVAQPKITPKATPVVKAPETPAPTPKASEPKVAEPKAEVKAAPATANSTATYYVQVGSFSKEPSKVLIDRLNASGMKYTAQKTGETTKILVGPFQGEKAVQDAMGNIRQNIEAKAFKIKG